jgi:hypothetical protein
LLVIFTPKCLQNLAFMMQNNAFLCVSADTKTWATCPIRALLGLTCGSPLFCHSYGVLRLPAGKHEGILTEFQT